MLFLKLDEYYGIFTASWEYNFMVSRFKIFHHGLPQSSQRLAASCIYVLMFFRGKCIKMYRLIILYYRRKECLYRFVVRYQTDFKSVSYSNSVEFPVSDSREWNICFIGWNNLFVDEKKCISNKAIIDIWN